MMQLIIRKSKNPGTGEERDGQYAARSQIGYEKDGSPMYRYFKTMEEYKTYLKNKDGGDKDTKPKKDDDDDPSLKEKLDKEQAQSRRKINKPGKQSLLVKKDK